MIVRVLAVSALALAVAAGASAETAAKPLRLIGEISGAKTPLTAAFVIDAVAKPGDGDLRTDLSGWFAGLGEAPPSGNVEGACVERHCVATVDVDDGKLTLTGDFGEATGPVAARYALKDGDGKVLAQGAVSLRPLTGPIPGLGALASGVDANALDDLLLWNNQDAGAGGHEAGEPPDLFEHEAVLTWQGQKGRPGAGLILASDIDQLRADAAAARKAAGWTAIGDAASGWSAGYPAALLPKVSRQGRQQRFSSADGKATLVVTIDPPLADDGFERFAKREEEAPGRSNVSYSRANDDMDLRYQAGDNDVVAAYYSRAGGFAQLVFTYPVSQENTYVEIETIVRRSLQVTDALKPR